MGVVVQIIRNPFLFWNRGVSEIVSTSQFELDRICNREEAPGLEKIFHSSSRQEGIVEPWIQHFLEGHIGLSGSKFYNHLHS